MAGQFVVHLGGGLYLDEEGRVTTGPQAESTQVYSGGWKLDTDKISKTLKDVAGFLKDEENLEKVRKLGLSPKMMKGVLEAATVGAIAASYMSVYFAVLGFMLAVLGELTKDDGMSPDLKNFLIGLKDDIKAVDDRLIADAMLGVQEKFYTAALNITGHLKAIKIQKLQEPASIAKYVEIQDEMKPLRNAITSLRSIDWSPLYRGDDYKEIFSLSAWMYSRKPDGAYTYLSVTPAARHRRYVFIVQLSDEVVRRVVGEDLCIVGHTKAITHQQMELSSGVIFHRLAYFCERFELHVTPEKCLPRACRQAIKT